jgi:hypothetical protein
MRTFVKSNLDLILGETEKRALELPGFGTTERQIHYLLARAYGQTGQKDLAEAHLAKFRSTPPTLRR